MPVLLTPGVARALNALALLGLAAVLGVAYGFQFGLGELPCPLCMLQRLAFVAMSVGLMLNLRSGLRPSHYGLVLIAAAFGAVVSARQLLLHIASEGGGYGSVLWGLHFYSWAFLLFAGGIVLVGVMLQGDHQFAETDLAESRGPLTVLGGLAFVVIVAVSGANVATTALQCGFSECADTPTQYRWLDPLPLDDPDRAPPAATSAPESGSGESGDFGLDDDFMFTSSDDTDAETAPEDEGTQDTATDDMSSDDGLSDDGLSDDGSSEDGSSEEGAGDGSGDSVPAPPPAASDTP